MVEERWRTARRNGGGTVEDGAEEWWRNGGGTVEDGAEEWWRNGGGRRGGMSSVRRVKSGAGLGYWG